MAVHKGTDFIKVKAYKYIEIDGKKYRFGSSRTSLNGVLEYTQSPLREDFCEILGDIRLDFSGGQFVAAVVPEGYRVYVDGYFLGAEYKVTVKQLEKFFAPVIKLKNKCSICCRKAGVICFNRSAGGRLLVCCENYYNEYSSMLLLMEQCEQKTPINDV